ncbi:MAG: HEAT repeat domain-containing protein [Planctomycetales bacterium]|nr:HEAT repeat domain-containing protein [Planctomycetales bacterium]
MDSPIPGRPRSWLRRWAPWLLGAGTVAVAGGILHALPGVEPDSGHWVCERTVFGPLAAGFARAAARREPWPQDLPELLRAAGYGEALPPLALRCPDDLGREARDPLADPSFVLVPGLRADMPPETIALYEREAFHSVPLHHASEGRLPGVAIHVATLGGDVQLGRALVGSGGEAAARAALLSQVESLVARDRRGLALASRARDARAGDEAARAALRAGLADGDERVRAFAAWTCAEAGDLSLVPALRAALPRCGDDRSSGAAEEIARALALLGDRSGARVLAEALEAEDPAGRRSDLGDPAPGFSRRTRAFEALGKLPGEKPRGYLPSADRARRAGPAAEWRAWAESR